MVSALWICFYEVLFGTVQTEENGNAKSVNLYDQTGRNLLHEANLEENLLQLGIKEGFNDLWSKYLGLQHNEWTSWYVQHLNDRVNFDNILALNTSERAEDKELALEQMAHNLAKMFYAAQYLRYHETLLLFLNYMDKKHEELVSQEKYWKNQLYDTAVFLSIYFNKFQFDFDEKKMNRRTLTFVPHCRQVVKEFYLSPFSKQSLYGRKRQSRNSFPIVLFKNEARQNAVQVGVGGAAL